jgi:hypothetical protein
VSIIGWYYLHVGGDLIYKRELSGTVADICDSDFARALWPVDPNDREGAWSILVESLSLGAKAERVRELAEKWHCTDDDAPTYAERIGAKLERAGDEWKAQPAGRNSSAIGTGPTALDALARLAQALGYTGGKLWNATLKDLLKSA